MWKLGKSERRAMLCSGNPKINTTVKSSLFGEMVAHAAKDGLKHYLSDLWHDAMWIDKLDGPRSFNWGVRDSGTFIGDTLLDEKFDGIMYQVVISKNPQIDAWYATFTKMEWIAEAIGRQAS